MEPISNPRKSILILLVEDKEAFGNLLTTIITKKIPETVIYSTDDGRFGLDSFRLNFPDIVITDIVRPGLDGICMAAEIKSIKPDAIIIAVTGHTDTQDLLETIGIGMDHHFLKPVSTEKLFAFIDKVVVTKTEIWKRKHSEETLHLCKERHKNELELTNQMLEQRVRERTADLEMAFRELESFNYSISHDLRAPLRHIHSYCTMLIEDYGEGLPREASGYLDKICAASSTMGKLIDHLLELSRVSRVEIKSEAVNLSEIAHQVLGRYQETDSQRFVEFSIAEEVVVWGDRILLRQLLENLLGNAWKYTGKTHAPRIEFGMTLKDGEEAFFVRDNGVGFDMAYMQRLFNPFERLHGSDFDGNGIGLVIAQKAVRRHGGKIWAEGKVGDGAVFYFTLPVYY